MNAADWQARDREAVWHPYTQMATAPLPVPILSAQGCWLHTADGRRITDLISSWWVTTHGHAHPHLAQAVARQAAELEQIIFAGFTHPQAVLLAERILSLAGPPFRKVFFSDNGSTAVEVALKMAWQSRTNRGLPARRILALEGAYHGDTLGSMSVSAQSVFTAAFGPLLFEVERLPQPTAENLDSLLLALRAAGEAGDTVALILEPLVQGAGGMHMYSPEVLEALTATAQQAGICVIFDEVMTGFGRTGTPLAMEQIRSRPDIFCLSKGLTGGFMPMSLTVCTQEIYAAFLSEDRSKALFHGHSFTANGLACAVANASLDLHALPENQAALRDLCAHLGTLRTSLAGTPGITQLRQTGAILAMDLDGESGYLAGAGPRFAAWFLEHDLLVRPLGSVLYFMPPYCTPHSELDRAAEVLRQGLARWKQGLL